MYCYQSSIYRHACCRKCCIHVRLIASAIDKQTEDMYDSIIHTLCMLVGTPYTRRGRQKGRKTRWWWWRWWKGLDSWKTMVHGTNLSWDLASNRNLQGLLATRTEAWTSAGPIGRGYRATPALASGDSEATNTNNKNVDNRRGWERQKLKRDSKETTPSRSK
jgi:hypothetical protein